MAPLRGSKVTLDRSAKLKEYLHLCTHPKNNSKMSETVMIRIWVPSQKTVQVAKVTN